MRLPLLLAALVLTACGSKEPETTITAADGSKVTVTGDNDGDKGGGSFKMETTGPDGQTVSSIAGEGATWPSTAPDYAAAYPGARITSVVEGNSDGKAGGMATFETNDSPAEVIAFYKSRAATAKLGRVTNISADAMTMFNAGDDASDRSVMVQATLNEGKTMGSVTFSAGKPG